jgi:hypothetical protein
MDDNVNNELDSLPVPTPPASDEPELTMNLSSDQATPAQQETPAATEIADQTQSNLDNEQAATPSITYFELPPHLDSTTVEMEGAILSHNPGTYDPNKETLVLPTDTAPRVAEYTSHLPNVEYDDDKSSEWLAAIQEGNENTAVRGGFFRRRLSKKNSKFRQVVRNEKGQILVASAPNIGSEGLSQLSGTHALIRMRSQMGMGHVLYVPLWHSGLWIALRAPSDGAIVNLFNRIDASKIRFGRATYGIAFGNSSVFYAQEVFNFAMQHMLETTLKDPTAARLEQYIKQPDLYAIVNALAALHWQKGFQYVRPLFDAGGKERSLIDGLIDLRKTMWVDNSVLTPRQIQMMSSRTQGSMTDEMLTTYQNEFTERQNIVRLSENRKMWLHFQVPSLKDYFNAGQAWVNGIVAMTEEAFSQDISDDSRNQRISLQAQASNMRQYSHWVEKITISEDPNDPKETVTKRETIDEMLADLSSDDEMRDSYFVKVREYIDDVTFVICAVPAFDKSEIEKTAKSRRFPILVPIDPLAAFFTLLVQKIRRISLRP